MTKKNEPSIAKLSDKADESFIKSGTELDDLIGGGFPRGRISELWGKEGVGKTQLATILMANLSQDQKVLYVDTEYSLNKARVASLGVNPSNVQYLADSRLERVCEALIEAVTSNKYDVIILDSLAMLTPLSVETAEVGERSIGLFALLLKHWVVKFRPLLSTSKTAFVALNQYRPPIGMFAVEQAPGGQAWAHSCDVRIKLTTNSADKIIKDKQQIGHYVNCEVKKNKLAPPFVTTKIKIIY
jgi:recombination protein RecA